MTTPPNIPTVEELYFTPCDQWDDVPAASKHWSLADRATLSDRIQRSIELQRDIYKAALRLTGGNQHVLIMDIPGMREEAFAIFKRYGIARTSGDFLPPYFLVRNDATH